MTSIKNLTIIGTSHISIESIKKVRGFIETKKPDIIALELDKQRLASLMSRKKQRLNPFKLGFKAYILNLIGAYVEKKLGKMVGVSPGSEMKTAINLAKRHNLKIAVIDQDISLTLRKLIKSVTFKEKMRFLKEILLSPFKRNKIPANFDLRKVPPKKMISEILRKVRKDYPNFYRVLVEERNFIMANNLKNISLLNPDKKILAIVGAGHEKGMLENLRRT